MITAVCFDLFETLATEYVADYEPVHQSLTYSKLTQQNLRRSEIDGLARLALQHCDPNIACPLRAMQRPRAGADPSDEAPVRGDYS